VRPRRGDVEEKRKSEQRVGGQENLLRGQHRAAAAAMQYKCSERSRLARKGIYLLNI